jgi:predicted Zn-dependent protease
MSHHLKSLLLGMPRAAKLLLVGWALALAGTHTARCGFAENALVSDSQTEQLLKDITDMARTVHKNIPQTIDFYLIVSPSFNAFTAGEPSVFINTGLIAQIKGVGQLATVLWHELGHMTKLHVSRHIAQIKNSRNAMLFPTLLGLIAAGVTQQWGVASVAAAAAETSALGSQMGHSRDQEFFADRFAAQVLLGRGLSTTPMQELFSKLASLNGSDYAPYLHTHPFPKDRARACQLVLQTGQKQQDRAKFPPALEKDFWCVQAKVIAFFTPPAMAKIALERSPIPASIKPYGHAVLAYRNGDKALALAQLNTFEKSHGVSAFTHELRAQILFQSGQTKPALQWIAKARALRPSDPLFVIFQAQVMLEDKQNPTAIVSQLEPLVPLHPFVPELWYWLAIAYGRLNRQDRMKVCLAEKAFLTGDLKKADKLVRAALAALPKTDPYFAKAETLLDLLPKDAS